MKFNNLLTGVTGLLVALSCWLGKLIWEDVATIKSATTATAVQVQSINHELDDHETRIRQTEKDVTILQQQQREDRRAMSPKLSDNKP